jgi:hypothetical protein
MEKTKVRIKITALGIPSQKWGTELICTIGNRKKVGVGVVRSACDSEINPKSHDPCRETTGFERLADLRSGTCKSVPPWRVYPEVKM